MTYHLPSSMIGCGGLADVDIRSLDSDEETYVERYCRLTGVADPQLDVLPRVLLLPRRFHPAGCLRPSLAEQCGASAGARGRALRGLKQIAWGLVDR